MIRDFSLDFVKAIAILAVIWGHISTPLGTFIFSWHMPAFFLAGGVLLVRKYNGREEFDIFSINDLMKYGKYYLLFGIIGIIAYYAKSILLHREVENIVRLAINFFVYMDMPHNAQHYGFVLWFLPAYFWSKLITRLYIKVKLKCTTFMCWIYLVLLFALGEMLIICHNLYAEFYILGIPEGIVCSIWMIAGTECGKLLEYMKNRKLIFNWIICICVILIFANILHIPHLNLGGYFAENIFVNLIWSSAFFVLIYLTGEICCKKLPDCLKNIINWLSVNSIYLMAFHVYTNNVAHEVLQRVSCNIWQINVILSYIILFAMIFIIRFFYDKWITLKS